MTLDLSCPTPAPAGSEQIQLAHGGGGRAMQELLAGHVLPACPGHQCQDAAVLSIGAERIAFTTDSYVVDPLFFAGGNIGSLAVYGTVNDLAMVGARPQALSLALLIEEGFAMAQLDAVMQAIHSAAGTVGVDLVTGDTKVVQRGKGDGLFINSSGVGRIETHLTIASEQIQAGDAILLSGDLGRHGMAIMAARESLQLDTSLQSDCAPLWTPVSALLEAGIELHCLRDLTRGGLAAALNELAQAAQLGMTVQEPRIAVCDEVAAICEILGLDPLHVANEGRFVAFLPSDQADAAIACLQPLAPDACIIGEVHSAKPGRVVLQNTLGVRRQLNMLSGEQLPRIC